MAFRSVCRLRARLSILTIVGLCLAPVPGMATILTVSPGGNGQYRVLQDALDAAAFGDTILVRAGFHRDYTELQHGGTLRKAVGFIRRGVTIMGENASAVIEGPFEVGGLGLYSLTTDSLTFVDLHFANTDFALAQAAGPGAKALVLRCTFKDCRDGVAVGAVGSKMWIRHCLFEGMSRAAIAGAVYSWARAESCSISGITGLGQATGVLATNGSYVELLDTDLQYAELAQANTQARIRVENCTARDILGVGLLSYGPVSTIEAFNVRMTGNNETIHTPIGIDTSNRGSFRGEGLLIDQMWDGLHVVSSGDVTLHNSQITNWQRFAVELDGNTILPRPTLDLTGNWWGTTDSLAIADAIFDGHDDPDRNPEVFVEFWPIAGAPLPVRQQSMGQIKAMFEGR